MDTPIPRLAIGVLIFNEKNQILFSRRLAKHANGTHCPPGGHIEFGETIEQASIREAKEETGLDINNIRVVSFTEDFHESENRHYVTFITVGTICGGELSNPEPHKHTPWEWVDWDKMPRPLLLSMDNFMKQNMALEDVLTRNIQY